MNIVVAGYGFVGKAHALWLEYEHDVTIYDPAMGYGDIHTQFDKVDGVIICVSTPEGETGECDMSNVYNVIEKCDPGTPILIKSTISLEGWRLIKRAYPDEKIAFSPEYLRAAHAIDDFKSNNTMQIGGDSEFWVKTFDYSAVTIVSGFDVEELIMIKYLRNSFLASKVAFFNQVYDMCENTGIDYETVRNGVAEDKRIGDSHTFVTQDRGYGGHCFPKDVSAIIASGHKSGTDLSILSEVQSYNERLKLAK